MLYKNTLRWFYTHKEERKGKCGLFFKVGKKYKTQEEKEYRQHSGSHPGKKINDEMKKKNWIFDKGAAAAPAWGTWLSPMLELTDRLHCKKRTSTG